MVRPWLVTTFITRGSCHKVLAWSLAYPGWPDLAVPEEVEHRAEVVRVPVYQEGARLVLGVGERVKG